MVSYSNNYTPQSDDSYFIQHYSLPDTYLQGIQLYMLEPIYSLTAHFPSSQSQFTLNNSNAHTLSHLVIICDSLNSLHLIIISVPLVLIPFSTPILSTVFENIHTDYGYTICNSIRRQSSLTFPLPSQLSYLPWHSILTHILTQLIAITTRCSLNCTRVNQSYFADYIQ